MYLLYVLLMKGKRCMLEVLWYCSYCKRTIINLQLLGQAACGAADVLFRWLASTELSDNQLYDNQ